MAFLTKQTFIIDASNALDNTSSLKIEDVTDLGAPGIPVENVDSVIKLTDPSGEVIYQNTDFDTPDIDYDVDRSFTIGVLNEDVATDLPLEGIYSLEMDTRIKSALSFASIFSNVVTAATSIKILQAIIIDETVDVIITTGAPTPSTNAGTYGIVSVTYDGDGYPTINIDAAIDPNPLLTDVIEVGVLEYEKLNKNFTYKFLYPELSLEVVSDCDYATIEFTDNTLFSYPITTDNRTATIKYPENAVTPPADIVFSSQSKKLSELYTGTYNLVVQREVLFTLSTTDQTFVESTLIASRSHIVDCSLSLCCISDCLSNLIKRYETALCNDYVKAKTLADQLLQITGKIQLARIIRYCGQSGYPALVSEIKALFGQTGCDCGCDEETDGLSRKVTPVTAVLAGGALDIDIRSTDGTVLITTSIVGTTTTYDFSISEEIINSLKGIDGATILTGEGAPLLSAGNIGDLYINTLNGDVYTKILTGGVPAIAGWVIEFNIKGDDGAAGPTGPAATDYVQQSVTADSVQTPIDLALGNMVNISLETATTEISLANIVINKEYLFTFTTDAPSQTATFDSSFTSANPSFSRVQPSYGGSPAKMTVLLFRATSVSKLVLISRSDYGRVDSVEEGEGISIDASNPFEPVIGLDSNAQAALELAATALQAGDPVSWLGNDAGYVTSSGLLATLNVGNLGAAETYSADFTTNVQNWTMVISDTNQDLAISAIGTAGIVDGKLYSFTVKNNSGGSQFFKGIVSFNGSFVDFNGALWSTQIQVGDTATFSFIGSAGTALYAAPTLILQSIESSPKVKLMPYNENNLNSVSTYNFDFSSGYQMLAVTMNVTDVTITSADTSPIEDGKIYTLLVRNTSGVDRTLTIANFAFLPANLVGPIVKIIPTGTLVVLTFIGSTGFIGSSKCILQSEVATAPSYQDLGTVTTDQTIAFASGKNVFLTLGNDDINIDFDNVVVGETYFISIRNGGAGTRSITVSETYIATIPLLSTEVYGMTLLAVLIGGVVTLIKTGEHTA
jgi:hypothetical protein